ncbi:hypothetical protein vBPmiSPMCJR_015 [Proteus phage vB_PmiS_PM-CJR]|nr:hypothetical protein [Proteus phage vB_PmiP_RS10pmA]QYC51745.1 hypothetical protein vBPmiSPMCJR_015 [Proteus phage vB_PmiS_PM-CJR]
MKASGQYVVTIEYHNGVKAVGYTEIALGSENITANEMLDWIKEIIELPENTTHYQITGIYKL